MMSEEGFEKYKAEQERRSRESEHILKTSPTAGWSQVTPSTNFYITPKGEKELRTWQDRTEHQFPSMELQVKMSESQFRVLRLINLGLLTEEILDELNIPWKKPGTMAGRDFYHLVNSRRIKIIHPSAFDEFEAYF